MRRGAEETIEARLTAIYQARHRMYVGLAYRYLYNAEAAEEVVQDAFLIAWERRATLCPAATSYTSNEEGRLHRWLTRVVVNRAIDVGRRRAGSRHVSFLSLDAPDALDALETQTDTCPGPDDVVEQREDLEAQRAQLRRMRQRVTPREWALLVAVDAYDYAAGEVAPLLGFTVAPRNAKTIVWRLRFKVRGVPVPGYKAAQGARA